MLTNNRYNCRIKTSKKRSPVVKRSFYYWDSKNAMGNKEIVYNKLIRDRIPEITAADGWISKTRILKSKEFITALKKKILEEAQELNEGEGDQNLVEELVDIQEIIDAILAEKKVKFSEFRKIQTKKRQKRGGFKKKLFLIKTRKVKND